MWKKRSRGSRGSRGDRPSLITMLDWSMASLNTISLGFGLSSAHGVLPTPTVSIHSYTPNSKVPIRFRPVANESLLDRRILSRWIPSSFLSHTLENSLHRAPDLAVNTWADMPRNAGVMPKLGSSLLSAPIKNLGLGRTVPLPSPLRPKTRSPNL